MSRPSLRVLTVLRFVAAMFVLIFHYSKKGQIFPIGVGNFGHEAVIFFFILSGFVLTYAHAMPGSERPLNVSGKEFLVARLGRIGPGYMVGLAIAAPFFFYAGLISHVVAKTQFYTGIVTVPLLLQAWYPPVALAWNAPAWSLSVEWFFYTTYPFLMSFVRSVSPIRLLLTSLLVVLLVGTWRQHLLRGPALTEAWTNFYAYFPLLHLPAFLLGIALGLTFLSHKPRAVESCLLFLAGAAGIAVALAEKSTHEWVANIGLLSALFCMIVFGAAGSTSRVSALVAPPLLELLGESSYAVYILHVPLGIWWVWFVKRTGVGPIVPWFDFLGYLSLTVTLSVLTFWVIEKPLRAWIRIRLLSPQSDRSQGER